MDYATLLLTNAQVLTMDRRPQASAVAVRGERIMAVGDGQDLAALKGPNTRLLDCQGATVLPGFIDAHLHLFAYAASLRGVDLSPRSVRSLAELQQAVRRRAEALPRGSWIRGAGYDEFSLLEGRYPTRHDLDQAAPHHPVKLTHRSGHAVVLNSLALRLVSITRDTPEPVDGVIERDETGEPTGILYEMEQWLEQRIPPLPKGELRQGIREASRRLLAEGITSVHDATPDATLERWRMLSVFQRDGDFRPRVYKMLGPQALKEAQRDGLAFRSGDAQLRLGAVKFMLHETTGSLQPPVELLREQVLEAAKVGFQVAFHAVEPPTIEAALDALEYCLQQGIALQRPRLEHCSLCPSPLLGRLKKVGALVVSNPLFLYHSGRRYRATVPKEEQPWLYRLRSFFQAGLHPAAGSDAPVTPPDARLGLFAAMTRRAEDGKGLQPQERLTFHQALAMHTLHGAYAAFEEHSKGVIRPGAFADLVVLDRRLDGRTEALEQAQMRCTVLGGEVWEPGTSLYCG
jgi:predicted amidohydrolase YtcJ